MPRAARIPSPHPSTMKRGRILQQHLRTTAAVSAFALGLATALTAAPAAAAPYTDQENVQFTASNGQSSQYHVYAAGVPQPSGLLIWTHGDGAWEFDHPDDPYVMGGSDGLRAVGLAHDYIVVSALAPDTDGTVTWWENGADNADYMADLITHLKAEYSIDSNDIVLAGFSGGAQFTTQYFLPEYSGMLDGGGSIVFGGGGAPETPDQQPWNEALKSTFYMHWATGEFDDAEHSDEDYDALWYAQEGVDYYSILGFETSSYWIPGHDHVIDGLFGGIIDEQLTLHDGDGQPADWSSWVDAENRNATVTVSIPATAPGSTTVRADGPGNEYWYQTKSATGVIDFRMGDPWDKLDAATTYTYTVTNGSTEVGSGTFTTDGWSTSVVTEDDYAYVTVIVPDGITGTTRVHADGPEGSYWYDDAVGAGEHTFRMGDPGDELEPATAYTFTVINGSERASGSFVTNGWATAVETDRRYAWVTVTIPDGVTGTTTVCANGPHGTFWYVSRNGSGDRTFRMGDPWDKLDAGTDYTFTVTHDGIERAAGSFTTDD